MSFVPSLYLLCSGCAWRFSQMVHPFIPVSRDGAGPTKVAAARRKQGRHEETTFLIIDAQSTKNTDTAVEKSYDAGRGVSSIKRHITVNKQGLPHAIAITTADVTDIKGCLVALERDRDNPGAEAEIAKRNELHRFAVLPKRWVIVGRNFSWLEKNRRLWKNCRRKLSTSPQK